MISNKRYKTVRAEWLAIKKELGTFGFAALILSMVLWVIFGVVALCKTLQTQFTIQEAVIFYDILFFIYSLTLIGFLYVHVLKIKNRKLRLK